MHHGAEIGGEGEERARDRLGGAVPRDELLVRHPAGRHHLGLEQRQHHVAAAEDERARPVEAVEDRQRLTRHDVAGDGQADQQGEEQDQRGDREAPGDRDPAVSG